MKLSNLSFEEKSTWVSLLIVLVVYSKYFSLVFDGLMNNHLNKAEISGMFIGAVVMLVIFQVVFHIIIAASNLKDADQPNDERDRLFAIKAGNASSYVLIIGVLTIAVTVFLRDLNSMWTANLLLLSLVVSQVVCYIMQLFYYRRGY